MEELLISSCWSMLVLSDTDEIIEDIIIQQQARY